MNSSAITAAPLELTLGTRVLRFSVLTDADYGEMEAFVQDRHVALVRRNVSEMPVEEQRRYLDKAFEEARALTLTSPAGLRYLRSRDAILRMIWLSARHNHPELTRAELSELLSDAHTLRETMERIEQLERAQLAQLPKAFRGRKEGKRKRRRVSK